MRDVAEQSVGWLVLAGIVLAVLLGRKRGREKFAAAVSQARAEGYAAARVELGVSQSVNVIAGNVAHDSRAVAHECANPYTCEVCAPVLLRVLSDAGRRPAAAAIESGSHDYNEHDDAAASYEHYSSVDNGRRGDLVAVEPVNSGRGAGAGDDRDRASGVRRVEGVPVAWELRPELAADMVRRPWAYDEAEPRFEHGVPVANGRRGRGPGG